MSTNFNTKKSLENQEEVKKDQNPNIIISNRRYSEKSNDQLTKIDKDLKILSNHVSLNLKRSTLNNGNIKTIFNNLLNKDIELQNLNNKESIIHHLDFIGQEQPVKKLKQNTRSINKKDQSMFISPIRKFSYNNLELKKIGSDFSLTPNKKSSFLFNENVVPIPKYCNNQKIIDIKKNIKDDKNNNNYDNNDNLNLNKGTIFSLADSIKENDNEIFSIGNNNKYRPDFTNDNFYKKLLKIGINNSIGIKNCKVRSLENNPRKMQMYEKNLFHLQKKELKVDMLRNKINKEIHSKLKETPGMGKNSQKIMSNKYKEKKDEIIGSKNNKLKKYYYNNDDTNSKWGDISALNQEKSSHSQIGNLNFTNLDNHDNFEYSQISKNPDLNSGKNTNLTYINNNKFLNFNLNNLIESQTPNSRNFYGNYNNNIKDKTFLKKINDTNNDLQNISAIPSLNQISEIKIKKNDKKQYPSSSYLNFLERKKNKNSNINKEKLNPKNKDKNEDKKLKEFKEFEAENHKNIYDIQYQERTLDWVRYNQSWIKMKKEKIEYKKKKNYEENSPKNLGFDFKPKVNKNSKKIINKKRALSQSQSEMNLQNNINKKENNKFNFDYFFEDNLSNLNDTNIFKSKSGNEFMNENNINNSNISMNNISNNKSQLKNSFTVYDNLYNRRFDSAIKREKIIRDISIDFTPKLNRNDFYINKIQTQNIDFLDKKYDKIPIPTPVSFTYQKKKYSEKDKRSEYTDKNSKNDKANKDNSLKKIFSPEKIIMNKYNRILEKEKKKKNKVKDIKIGKYIWQNREEKLNELLENVDKENKQNEKKVNNNKEKRMNLDLKKSLYKFNIRSASASDFDKENKVFPDENFVKVLTKLYTKKN
jgi:hypothetical protein